MSIFARTEVNTILGCMDNLGDLGLVDDGDIVLDEAALTLAQLDHDEADVAAYEDVLSDIASRLDEVGAGAADASGRAACLAQVLAEEFGFAGDVETYDDPDNADLIRVIDRLRGLPISLSILYVAAARRVGWEAEILNLPGHVLVMVGHEAEPVIIDPFRGGVHVGVEEITVLLASAKGGVSAAVRHVAAMPNRAILVRLLLNQATRAEKAGRSRRALSLYSRMTSIAPDYPHPWWERARLELIDNDVAAARASLTAMLEITREPALRKRVTSTLDALAAR
jgi:regulator of sirC expression with transglutaminase-like and TPR domain